MENKRKNSKFNILKIAISGDENAFSSALSAGADIYEEDSKNNCAIEIAVKKNNANIVYLLLDYDAEYFLSRGMNAAINCNNYQLTKGIYDFSISKNININKVIETYFAQLNALSSLRSFSSYKYQKKCNIEILKFLNLVSRKNKLHDLFVNAAANGKNDEVKLFLDNDYIVDCIDHMGNTPLFVAATKNHYKTVYLLLKHGANVNLKNSDGESAIDFAVENKSNESCFFIIYYGSSVNKKYIKYAKHNYYGEYISILLHNKSIIQQIAKKAKFMSPFDNKLAAFFTENIYDMIDKFDPVDVRDNVLCVDQKEIFRSEEKDVNASSDNIVQVSRIDLDDF